MSMFQYVRQSSVGNYGSSVATFSENTAGDMIVVAFLGAVNSEYITTDPFLGISTITDSAGNVYTQYATTGANLYVLPTAYFAVYVCTSCVASSNNSITMPSVAGASSFTTMAVEYEGGLDIALDASNCRGEQANYVDVTNTGGGDLAIGLGVMVGFGSIYFATTPQTPEVTMRYPQAGSSPPTSSPLLYQDCILGAAGYYQQYFTGEGESWYVPFLITIKGHQTQVITFNPTTPVNYIEGLKITLIATGGASGNPVTFTLDPSSTGTGSILDNILSVETPGTFVINANQAAGGGYAAANQVQATITTNLLPMMILTNEPYPNRIQWILGSYYVGPFLQNGPFGDLDPRRDLEVYVDGTLTPVNTFVFDAVNNRYLLYTEHNINLQGVIQVIHHMPNPPFYFTTSFSPIYLPSFALKGYYTTAGDTFLPISATAAIVATQVSGGFPVPSTPIFVAWSINNIANVQITGNNGVDPIVDSGLITTQGMSSGSFEIVSGFTNNIILTFQAYDSSANIVVTQLLPVNYIQGAVTALPQFSIPAGTYTSSQTVAISDVTPGTTLYYTIDGSTPTTSSPVYSVPLTIASTTTIKAWGVTPSTGGSSNVAVATYTIIGVT